MDPDRDAAAAAAEERAEDRATASGILPDPRTVTTEATRKKARRKPRPKPSPYNPPVVRPTKEHIEAGRAGLAASRAALAAASNRIENPDPQMEENP